MSAPVTYNPPRRRPGHESLEKLLDAAEDQLREEELDCFTVDKVLERAGVSVGSFYARFPAGKDALLTAVQNRVYARMQPAILEALEAQQQVDQSLDQAVERAFDVLIEQVMKERLLCRAFMMFSAFDPAMRLRGEQIHLERRHAVAAVLAKHLAEIGHPDPEAAIDLAYAMYSSTMHGRLVFYGPSKIPRMGVNEDDIFAQLKVGITNFLRGNDRGGARSVG
jgi:AcrR family transcriptional regulator